jgi:hypothetical protein
MTDLKLEHIAALRDYVNPQLFPYGKKWDNEPIMCVDGDDEMIAQLEKQFPETRIKTEKASRLLEEPHHMEAAESHSYIVAMGIKDSADAGPKLLEKLIKRLAPGGVMAAAVHGYAGYYGLEMLRKIIRNYSKAVENDGKATAKIVKAVLANLPDNHPARRQDEFIKRLERGENTAIDTLQNINENNSFTVTQLLEKIRKSGGRMVDWIFPAAYEPARYMTDIPTRETLETLPEPQRWEVAELVNAQPSEHYVFIGKEEDVQIKIPWESGDLYQWRPKRLPLYRWEQLPESPGTEQTVKPLLESEEYGFEPVKLMEWQWKLCFASDGTANLNQIQASLKIPSEQIRDYLRTSVQKRLLTVLPPAVVQAHE